MELKNTEKNTELTFLVTFFPIQSISDHPFVSITNRCDTFDFIPA